jgi:hypothetical protein
MYKMDSDHHLLGKTPSLFQYRILVELFSDYDQMDTRHLNEWSTGIEENRIQHLLCTGSHFCDIGPFVIFSQPLIVYGPSLRLKHMHPNFITCQRVRNNPTSTFFVCFQTFLNTLKTLFLLLLSEQMW